MKRGAGEEEGAGEVAKRDGQDVIGRLQAEIGLSKEEANYYLKLIEEGSRDASTDVKAQDGLFRRGMVILAGDGKRILPVHPRLGLANQYRTWRENIIREINERRMRMDKLILELIPMWDAAMEKRARREEAREP